MKILKPLLGILQVLVWVFLVVFAQIQLNEASKMKLEAQKTVQLAQEQQQIAAKKSEQAEKRMAELRLLLKECMEAR